MAIRDRLYRFSRRLSTRLLLLALYYVAFFFVFFAVADDSMVAIEGQPGLSRLLSAMAMGALFTLLHLYLFRPRK